MAKTEQKPDRLNLVVTVCEQHKSLVITIPKLVRSKLGIERGDYVNLCSIEGSDIIELTLFKKRKIYTNGSERNPAGTNFDRRP